MSHETSLSLIDPLLAAEETLSIGDPLERSLRFQLALNQRMLELIPAEKRVVNSVPEALYGAHQVAPAHLVPTTSEITMTQSGLALKHFSFRDPETESFRPNDHGLYLLTDARVRVMCAAGEVAIGQLMNAGSEAPPLYYGLATMSLGPNNTVILSKLDETTLWQAVRGQQEVCIVMRRMQGSWLDLAIEVKNGMAEITEAQFADQVEVMLERLFNAATPLEADQAAAIGSPQRTRKTLVDDTPAWLAKYRSLEDYTFGQVQMAAETAASTIDLTQEFFDLPETTPNLEARAIPSRTHGQKTTAVQSYSSGDTKFGNILFDGHGHPHFSDGLSLIVKTDKVPGNPEPVFAPWAFNDIMQSVAYFAIEPRVLGLSQVNQRIKDSLKAYVSQTEVWTPWHDLYFEVLVAYKLLVEAACAVDNYIAQCDPVTRQPLTSMDEHTKRKVEDYPAQALSVVREALAEYYQLQSVAAD